MSNHLYTTMLGVLTEITASTRSTEVTTTQVTSRVMDAVVAQMQSRVARTEEEIGLRVSEALTKTVPRGAVPAAKREVAKELQEAFSTLRSVVAPSAPDYDWGPFIRRLDHLERRNRFLSVKRLHRTIFADEPGTQEALQLALKRKLLLTYNIQNPRDAKFPTLCCKLDRSDPLVIAALKSEG